MTEMYTPADAAVDDARDQREPTRRPVQLVGTARGYVLEGFMRDPRDGSVVVLLHRPFDALDPYLTGRVDRLTNHEWRHGHYFGNRRAAARSMIRRAGVDVE